MSQLKQMEHPKRILLVRLGGFGDVIFTLPAVHLLRTAFPDAQFTFLVYKEFSTLLKGFPGVSSVLTLDRKEYRTFNPFTILAHTGALLKELSRARFGLVVDFQGFGETGFLSWLTRAPQRWGSVYRAGRKWAYTQAVWRNMKLHPINYHLELLEQAGGVVSKSIHNEFVPPEQPLEEARSFFAKHKLEADRPTLFIQAFTSSQHKSWPLERFLATARLWEKRGLQIIFGGGPGDKEALAPANRAGFIIAAGAPPLVSAGLVKLSTFVLGGDTGLLHLAVAMGKRVVMIMRSLHPGACFPFGHREWAIVPRPGLLLDGLSEDEVNEACARALAELDSKSVAG